MTDEEIKRRLNDQEDGWVERKAGVIKEEISKSLVAFANSLRKGEEAIIFVGVRNDGSINGVPDTEKMQQIISGIAKDICYPSVSHSIRVLEINGEHILAIIVTESQQRPHFAGLAYIRTGSRSERASEVLFNELIASRSSKVCLLIEAKRKAETVKLKHWKYGTQDRLQGPVIYPDCIVMECHPSLVSFQSNRGEQVSVEPEKITLTKDPSRQQLQVEFEW